MNILSSHTNDFTIFLLINEDLFREENYGALEL